MVISADVVEASAAAGTATTPSAAAVIAATVARLGAQHVFALMGGTNMRVVHHLAGEGLVVHHFRHENGAVGAADGYARVTGEVAWSSVIHGPGLTNAITALRTAVKARSPQVLIMADTAGLPPRNSPFDTGIQGLSPEAILSQIGVPVVRASAASAAYDTVRAHQAALHSLSPVALVIPFGVEAEPSGGDPETAIAELVRERPAVVPSAEAIDAASRRSGPAGGSSSWPGAGRAIRRRRGSWSGSPSSAVRTWPPPCAGSAPSQAHRRIWASSAASPTTQERRSSTRPTA